MMLSSTASDHPALSYQSVLEEVVPDNRGHRHFQQKRGANTGERVSRTGWNRKRRTLRQQKLFLSKFYSQSSFDHKESLMLLQVMMVGTGLAIEDKKKLTAVAEACFIDDPKLGLSDFLETIQAEMKR